jgi:hypothetical protein
VKKIITSILIFSFCHIYSQETTYLKVHFLYGSKPKRAYKETEAKWFGGVLGGHAGIEGDSNRIVNFLPKGKFHVFTKKQNKHSTYAEHSVQNFYSILGGDPDSVKIAIVHIPITKVQKQKFDSIATRYLKEPPYDYALIGMRCGSATYDILGQLGILPAFSYKKTYKKIFYPQKLRVKLLEKAKENNWTEIKQAGSDRRIWESD